MIAGPGKGPPEVTKLEQVLEGLEGGLPWEGVSPGALHSRKELVLSQKVPVQGLRLGRASVPLTSPALSPKHRIIEQKLLSINSEPGGAPGC